MDARLNEAGDELALLRGEVRQLRTEVSIEKLNIILILIRVNW